MNAVKENDERLWFVVMVVTSSANLEDRQRADEFGVIHDFSTKPPTPEALTAMLSDFDLADYRGRESIFAKASARRSDAR